ncbi:MAG: SAM-dependent methyltransferase [Parcubacteria group bacterium Gr01-1014_29]|nr:MAG: SAM-dependent methyltransferase [Parcubacteria group bacterium Gr01-1014_29]
MSISDQKFYDKVAKKFGGYKSEAIHENHFPSGNPEEIFLEQLIKYSGKDKTVLDIGCADGRFTLKIAEKFYKIFGIDISSEMLAKAKQFQEEQNISNAILQKAEAEKLPFQDKYFDLIYSRRGPSPYAEIGRIIKSSGYYLEICIGEKDGKELKEVFGRGQGFGDWNISVAKTKSDNLVVKGFKVVFVHDYFYSEIYPDIENLNLFLQSVPIFKDFDQEKDRENLRSYSEKFNVSNGIELKRHRIVIVAEKL